MVLRENLYVDDELENRSLQPLYARPAPTLKNPVQDRLFAQLGKCLGFEARPTVMHFGGFEVGAIHTQYLKILNISKKKIPHFEPNHARIQSTCGEARFACSGCS